MFATIDSVVSRIKPINRLVNFLTNTLISNQQIDVSACDYVGRDCECFVWYCQRGDIHGNGGVDGGPCNDVLRCSGKLFYVPADDGCC